MDLWNGPVFQHAVKPLKAAGKKFLQQELSLTGMELSLNSLPPGDGPRFLHRHHKHEEVYLFIEGAGEFQVDGERFPVTAGSAVRVAPHGKRAWRNTGTRPLVYIVIQAPAGGIAAATIEDGEALREKISWE